ncbi:MAG TPA: glycoside hydrolase family 6 protein [Acidimicrobiia bacterium]|nr:glycoside hydrolase family 6 protein [Acidimicrobiia bacterium]
MRRKRASRLVTLALALLVFMTAAGPAIAHRGGRDDFYTPPPSPGSLAQIRDLRRHGQWHDASLISKMIKTPSAVWFNGGTPREVRKEVAEVVRAADRKHTVPVLVAYNIPFRDCAQFSAGGATTVEEYKAWIDGFAKGIGWREAIVILEPDGLGIIPWYTPIGAGMEWCQPAEANPATAASERFEMLNYAVDQFAALPNVNVYLDGTHSAWLNVGDASDRLVKAGVQQADGFYLNVSNYQFTANLGQYGNWISSCITYATVINPGDFINCPNQYWNGGPLPAKIAVLLGEWTGVALSNYGEWSDTSDDPALNTSGINLRYANMLGAVGPTTHFVVDTSRNGQGPWSPTPGYPDPQDWCNPPDRGLGLRPTTDTGNALIDAYLWVKIPGESDGECTRGLGPAGTTVDPEWGLIDPPAGVWFPEMALQLATNANPPLN